MSGLWTFPWSWSLDQPKVTPKEEIGVDQDEVDEDGGPQVRGGQYAPTD